jgi:hypothetical protein
MFGHKQPIGDGPIYSKASANVLFINNNLAWVSWEKN